MSSIVSEVVVDASTSTRRATLRYACVRQREGQVVLLEESWEYTRAWIKDVSLEGVGLRLSRSLPTGTILTLQIRVEGELREWPAEVKHSTQLSAFEWHVGCQLFQGMDEATLRSLVATVVPAES